MKIFDRLTLLRGVHGPGNRWFPGAHVIYQNPDKTGALGPAVGRLIVDQKDAGSNPVVPAGAKAFCSLGEDYPWVELEQSWQCVRKVL